MDPAPDRLVVYPSRLKTLAMLAVCALVCVVPLIIPADAGLVLAWALCLPLAATAGLYALYRIAVPRPALLLDEQGITDNASAAGVGFIGWDEIQGYLPCTYMGQPMLVIVPKDSDAILTRQNWLKRRLLRMNLRFGYPLINIPQVILPVTVDQLAVWVYQRLDAVALEDAESAYLKSGALEHHVVRLRGDEHFVIRDQYE